MGGHEIHRQPQPNPQPFVQNQVPLYANQHVQSHAIPVPYNSFVNVGDKSQTKVSAIPCQSSLFMQLSLIHI